MEEGRVCELTIYFAENTGEKNQSCLTSLRGRSPLLPLPGIRHWVERPQRWSIEATNTRVCHRLAAIITHANYVRATTHVHKNIACFHVFLSSSSSSSSLPSSYVMLLLVLLLLRLRCSTRSLSTCYKGTSLPHSPSSTNPRRWVSTVAR